MSRPTAEERQEAYRDAVNSLDENASRWQGNTPTDRAARALIASCRPLINFLGDEEEIEDVNPMVFNMMVKVSDRAINGVEMLTAMAKLRDKK